MSDKKDIADIVLKLAIEAAYNIYGIEYAKAYLRGSEDLLSVLKEQKALEKDYCEELEEMFKESYQFLDELDAQKRFDNAVTTN